MVSLKTKILSSLKEGNEVSAKQFAARNKTTVATIGARVSELRRDGFAIYSNKHTDSQGRTVNKYRLGTPSRAVVAAGYAALSA